MTTSAGLTKSADIEPDAHPDINDHQNTDSVEPGYFLGPMAFRLANRGKYTTEKDTSLSIVAPVPLYNPEIPLVRSNSLVILSAESFVLDFASPENIAHKELVGIPINVLKIKSMVYRIAVLIGT